jgi:menaquinone-dependent protoporphyrinogen oxidase
VADAVAEELRSKGAQVDVQRAGQVRDISPYAAVVVGTSIHGGKMPGEIPGFVKRHRAALAQRPLAYFVVCLTMAEDTPENRRTALAYLDPLNKIAPDLHAVDTGLFAGAVLTEGEDFRRLFPFFKFIVRSMAKEMPDHRDWDAIRAWAHDLYGKLTKES